PAIPRDGREPAFSIQAVIIQRGARPPQGGLAGPASGDKGMDKFAALCAKLCTRGWCGRPADAPHSLDCLPPRVRQSLQLKQLSPQMYTLLGILPFGNGGMWK